MNFNEFKKSLENYSVPENIAKELQALWHDAKGDWDKAHSIVQNLSTKAAEHIHAYLHRKEGDDSNAMYWYSRAGESFCSEELDAEWRELVKKYI